MRLRIRHLFEWIKGTEWKFEQVQNPYTTIWLILDGDRELHLDDQWYRIKRGDFVVITPYTSISLRATNELSGPLHYLSLGCEWTWGAFEFVQLYQFPEVTHLDMPQFQSLKEAWVCLHRSWESFTETVADHTSSPKNIKNPPKIRNTALPQIDLPVEHAEHFFQIKRELFQWLTVVFRLLKNKLPVKPTLMDERVQKVCLFVDNHYAEKLTMRELCETAYISESQLRVLFKKTLDISPMDYLLQFRLQKAKELLMLTDEPIGTIANECGFEELSYFSRMFRKRENVSPREYRKRNAEARM
jgi:AraC-like DNA-binding protein